tara:strand:- start:888 stop:1139 length:252 start_codon:yes stop_codon:yes gene_type:complete
MKSPYAITITSKANVSTTLINLSIFVSSIDNLSGYTILDPITGTKGRLTFTGNGVYSCQFIENSSGRQAFIANDFSTPECIFF